MIILSKGIVWKEILSMIPGNIRLPPGESQPLLTNFLKARPQMIGLKKSLSKQLMQQLQRDLESEVAVQLIL